jgi:hypothetical protein
MVIKKNVMVLAVRRGASEEIFGYFLILFSNSKCKGVKAVTSNKATKKLFKKG